LFDHYQSLGEAVQKIYPAESWDPSKFHAAGRHSNKHWTDPHNQRKILDQIALDLKINQVQIPFLLQPFSLP